MRGGISQFLNPMADSAMWPDWHFINPDETVRGSILENDSKAATRSHALDARHG